MHIVSGCEMLCGTKYLYRHNKIGAYIHLLILWYNGFRVCQSWLHHVPLSTTTNVEVTIYQYIPLLTDKMVKFNIPYIVIWNSAEELAHFIGFMVPQDYNVVSVTADKITKHKYLQIEIQNARSCKNLLLCSLWLVNLVLHVTYLQ